MSFLRRGPARRDVESQLEITRGLVAILKLSRANLRPADALLDEAAVLFGENDLAMAKETIERAERIATALEGDYRAATDVVEKLRERVAAMKSLGVSVVEQERALEEIHKRATSTRDLEGRPIPDYAGARSVAEEAWGRLEAAQSRSDQASDAIFTAELTLDGAAEAFPHGTVEALDDARRLLERSRAALSAGNFEMAVADASAAEKAALGVVDQRRRALETRESVERLIVGLKGLGIPVGSIAKSLDLGGTLLGKGKLVAATEVFNESAQEAVELGTAYRQLLDALTGAGKAIEGLRSDALPTTDAESALARARAAMKAGNYALARGLCEDVQLAVQRQREVRDGLRSWLEDTKSQIEALRKMGLAYVNDVEEMVAKAEREFVNGDFTASTEDLRIASLLMKPALNGRVRDGPELAR